MGYAHAYCSAAYCSRSLLLPLLLPMPSSPTVYQSHSHCLSLPLYIAPHLLLLPISPSSFSLSPCLWLSLPIALPAVHSHCLSLPLPIAPSAYSLHSIFPTAYSYCCLSLPLPIVPSAYCSLCLSFPWLIPSAVYHSRYSSLARGLSLLLPILPAAYDSCCL